jgi:hypothetical protein
MESGRWTRFDLNDLYLTTAFFAMTLLVEGLNDKVLDMGGMRQLLSIAEMGPLTRGTCR